MTEIHQTMNIIVNLCDEDRARLDKITERLEAQITLAQYIIGNGLPATMQAEPDELTKKLQDVANRAKNATEAAEAQTLTTTPPEEETPTVAEETKPTPTKTVTRNELATKVRELMTNGHKEQVKEIVRSYAPTVPGVPEDKVAECYARLVALEG